MKCRQFESDDLSYLVEMYRLLRIDEQQPDQRPDADLCQHLRNYLDDGYQCYFYENEDAQVIGYILFKESSGGVFLKHLFIGEAFRRQGHARRFLRYFIDGVWLGKSVSLEVLSVNEAAIAFYESMSFLLHSHLFTRPPLA